MRVHVTGAWLLVFDIDRTLAWVMQSVDSVQVNDASRLFLCDGDGDSLASVLGYFQQLRTLEFDGAWNTRITWNQQISQTLQEISIFRHAVVFDTTTLAAALRQCSALERFVMHECFGFTEQSLIEVLQALPDSITALRLSCINSHPPGEGLDPGCNAIAFTPIANAICRTNQHVPGRPNLRHLRLAGFTTFSDADFTLIAEHCRGLVMLSLSHTDVTVDGLKQNLESLNHLTTVSVLDSPKSRLPAESLVWGKTFPQLKYLATPSMPSLPHSSSMHQSAILRHQE
jgi:hypothetical protein